MLPNGKYRAELRGSKYLLEYRGLLAVAIYREKQMTYSHANGRSILLSLHPSSFISLPLPFSLERQSRLYEGYSLDIRKAYFIILILLFILFSLAFVSLSHFFCCCPPSIRDQSNIKNKNGNKLISEKYSNNDERSSHG